MKAGDWVYSYRKGIFRIDRIVKRYYQASDRGIWPGKWKVGDEIPSPMVVSKKAFSPDFRPRIDWDCCDTLFIRPVGSDVQKKIRTFLKANPDFLRKLNAYRIPPVGSLYHFHLASMPSESECEKLIQFVQKGRTFRQVRSHLNKIRLAVHLGQPIVGTLMLINNDQEIDFDSNRQLIYRDARFLPYQLK